MGKLEKNFSHLNKSIFFLGAIYNEKILEHYISNAALFVSPGNVGLACIHSLSYIYILEFVFVKRRA